MPSRTTGTWAVGHTLPHHRLCSSFAEAERSYPNGAMRFPLFHPALATSRPSVHAHGVGLPPRFFPTGSGRGSRAAALKRT
jgi:hypothetical protein